MKQALAFTLYAFLMVALLTGAGIAAALTPNEVVTATTNEVTERLQRDRERLDSEPGYIKVIVDELIVPHMDFETMAGLVLGKDFRILSQEVARCFSAGFRNQLVERYSDILLSYRDQDIEYAPAKPIGEKGYVSVTQTLTRPGRMPLTIGYPMRPHNGDWKVVDLVVDDVSLVRSYRMMYLKDIDTLGLAEFLYSFPECTPLQ